MDRAALIRGIEQAALWAWPPLGTRLIDGWLIAWGGRANRRLRSARTLDFTGKDVGKAIQAVETFLAAQGVPSCFHIADLVAPSDLDGVLAARGYALVTPTSVLLAPIPTTEPDPDVELLTRATPGVMNALCDERLSPDLRAERAAILARIRRPHRLGLVWQEGEPAAAALCVRDGDLAGIFAMRSVPRFRRRGLGRRVLSRLARWAAGEGAQRLYLQVEDDNAPAHALYRSLGFNRAYDYHYRERSP
jgi:GNAT superfamily N-acetyltransferase